MSKKNTKSNSLSNKIKNLDEEFEKVSDDLDRELSKVEKVADVFNDSLDRIAGSGSVSEQEVDKFIEEMQSEVNLDKKSAALGKQKDQELEARLKAIRDPRPTEEALKNPAPVPTVEELEARLKKLKDSTPTVEKPQKKVDRSKDNQTKQPQSIKPTTKVVDKVAVRPKDNKLEANSPATSPEPLVKEPSKSDKSDRDTLQPSMTQSKQTGWFAKIASAIIDVIVDNIKGLLGNSQIQDSSKQQNQQMTLEKMQADVKKLNEPLVALKKVQELRKHELKAKKIKQSLQKVRPGKALPRTPVKSSVTRQKSNTNSR
ncbi:MAG: hypothetical protein LN575_03810 [Rickettsia endosymbiont of Gnoriste bilineata]|nr:hypothetical protein [Rickettsia endosymbiont of Gnoriste bilineata]